MADELNVGDKIPPFFVKDHEGFNVSDQDVIGTPMVIFFYPKDGTETCTKEVCAFRDNMLKFDEKQVLLVGVSPDSVDTHKDFIEKNKLELSLLSDEKKDMCRMFGALDDKDEVVRTTFVINSQGQVKWMEKPVKVDGHVDRVLQALEEHCKNELARYDDFEGDYAEFLKGNLELTDEEKKLEKEIMKEFGIKEGDFK